MVTTQDEREINLARAISDATIRCSECQEPVFWAETFPGGKSILLDAEQGKGFVIRRGLGKFLALPDTEDYVEGSHHRSHWAKCKPSAPRHGLSWERVDDDDPLDPATYVAYCDCGVEFGPKSQTLIRDEFRAHLKEAG